MNFEISDEDFVSDDDEICQMIISVYQWILRRKREALRQIGLYGIPTSSSSHGSILFLNLSKLIKQFFFSNYFNFYTLFFRVSSDR